MAITSGVAVVVLLVALASDGGSGPAVVPAGDAAAVFSGEGGEAAGAVADAVTGSQCRRTRDAAGARAAALAFVELNEQLVEMDDRAALEARRGVSATGAADALAEALASKLRRLRERWPTGTLSYRVAPLAVRVRPDGADAFMADVWHVGVVAGRNLATYEEWNTETYRLVWERDDWRMASEATMAGPRPEPSRQPRASSAEIEARLAGFESVR